jgi:hypothetical protein
MARFVLHHSHPPHDSGVVFAGFEGHDSTPRHQPTPASCDVG